MVEALIALLWLGSLYAAYGTGRHYGVSDIAKALYSMQKLGRLEQFVDGIRERGVGVDKK